MPLELQLVYRERPQREAAAVLLPGDDAGTWLRTLALAEVPLAEAKFLPLPVSRADRRVRGALVLVPGDEVRRLVHAGPRYGAVARRLYVPVEGTFEPPIAEAEWKDLLSDDDSFFVWHPAVGLVQIEASEILRAADLIRLPAERESDWSRAEAAAPLNNRLFSLEIDEPPTLAGFFGTAGDGIGDQAQDLSKLPKLPGEPGMLDWRKLVAGPLRAMLSLMQRMGARRPQPGQAGRAGGGAAGGFAAKMSQWLAGAVGQGLGRAMSGLAGAMSRVTASILSERAREIERLLSRFETDPDEALRYALPMGGEAGRGLAIPGSSLIPRNVDFSLGGGEGGPVDAWSLPIEIQAKLLVRYRDAAQREIRLGRYRRAAYIFSKLLGDDRSAAAALETGRFHLEAAVLYRDRLKQPLEAARCLARGGLLREAIEIYRSLGCHLDAGDLFARLEEPAAAEAEYRIAIAARLEKHEYIEAAELLTAKLVAEDEALEVLARGWPRSPQAAPCLARWLDSAARLGRHALADQFVKGLADPALPIEAQSIVLKRLPETAIRYPDPAVQRTAAEGVRTIASRRLVAGGAGQELALRAVEQLVPGDLLLGRDCRRYRPIKRRPPPPPPKSDRQNGLVTLVRTVSLSPSAQWLDFRGTATGYAAVGTTFDGNALRLVVHWGTWDGERTSSHQWPVPGYGQTFPPAVVMTVHDRDKTRIHLNVMAARHPLFVPPLELADLVIASPAWLCDPGALAIDRCGDATWILDENYDVRMVLGDETGLPMLTRAIESRPIAAVGEVTLHVALHARKMGGFVAVGTDLFVISTNNRIAQYELAEPVTRMFGTPPQAPPRIAILSENGGQLFLPEGGGDLHPLPPDLQDPMGVFLRDGRLILWSRVTASSGQFLVLDAGAPSLGGKIAPAPGMAPTAMLPTARPDEFAFCLPTGEVQICKVATRG